MCVGGGGGCVQLRCVFSDGHFLLSPCLSVCISVSGYHCDSLHRLPAVFTTDCVDVCRYYVTSLTTTGETSA